MGETDETYDSIRKRAEQRVKKRKDAIEDLVAFVVVNGILWVVWFFLSPSLSQSDSDLLPLISAGLVILTSIWGVVVAWQIVTAYLQVWLDNLQEREVEREIQRELTNRVGSDKPKRGRLALSDDGELLDIVDFDDEVKPKRGERHPPSS
jgi:hypothetical protein